MKHALLSTTAHVIGPAIPRQWKRPDLARYYAEHGLNYEEETIDGIEMYRIWGSACHSPTKRKLR